MFSSMFDYFICYHLESGWHVTRPNQSFSRERKEPGNEVARRREK